MLRNPQIATALCVLWLATVSADEATKRTVSSVEFYFQTREEDVFTGKKHPPTILPKEVEETLLKQLKNIDFNEKNKFVRETRTSPDCRFVIYFGDKSSATFYILHETTLVSSDYSHYWTFKYGEEFLKRVKKK